MKTRQWKLGNEGWNAKCVLECGGKRSATPLSDGAGFAKTSCLPLLKRRRCCALPPHSKIRRHFAALICFFILPFIFCLPASAQSYSIDWHKIAGGGGTSTGGVYSVSGTIGQHDAGPTASGGGYSLTGGFWSLISVVQTAGAPTLRITHTGSNVVVSWPAGSTGWALQQSDVLNAPNWMASAYSITNDGTNNNVTISSPKGQLFFRLAHP